MQNAATGGGFTNGWHCAAHIVRAEGGPRALFAGLPALLFRDVPFNAVFIPTYRFLVGLYRHAITAPKEAPVPAWLALGAGGAAGATAWVVVFPMDVIKSRAQGSSRCKGESLLGALRAVLATGGPAALYRGVSAACLRAFPANAALLFGVEQADNALKRIGW